MQLADEVHLEGAAYTAVLQGYQGVVLLRHHPALLNEGSVDIHFADIIDDNGKANTFLVSKNTIEQRGLTTSQITGD